MAKSKTGEFKMDKPYGLTMRGIVKNSNDEILILRRHPKSRTNPHKWELPGGKVDPGEFFDEALVREIKEETNLDISDLEVFNAVDDIQPGKHYITIQLIANKFSGELINLEPNKHDQWKWFRLDNLPTNLYTPTKEFIQAYLNRGV